MTRTFTLRTTPFDAPELAAGLYLVATPIGNLGDITIRALEVLAGCAVIACEDTRTTGVLLARYGIETSKLSYTEHNADARGGELLDRVASGEAVALVSDAGTPLISDPGFRLVRDAAERGLPVHPIPGASAPVAALIGSGIGDAAFRFAGFLPSKSKARQAAFQTCEAREEPSLFFEAPTRIIAALKDAADVLGADHPICVAREMTKMHETFHRGTVSSVLSELEAMERVRGEIVLVVGGAIPKEATPETVDAALREALTTMKTKDAARHVAALTGAPQKELYARALDLKDE